MTKSEGQLYTPTSGTITMKVPPQEFKYICSTSADPEEEEYGYDYDCEVKSCEPDSDYEDDVE